MCDGRVVKVEGSNSTVWEDHLKPSTCPYATVTSEPYWRWHMTIWWVSDLSFYAPNMTPNIDYEVNILII